MALVSRLIATVIGCPDPRRLAAFHQAPTGWVVTCDNDEAMALGPALAPAKTRAARPRMTPAPDPAAFPLPSRPSPLTLPAPPPTASTHGRFQSTRPTNPARTRAAHPPYWCDGEVR
jgi:hypothetical protein